MNEKTPELFVTFKVYKNSQLTIEYKGETLTTELNSVTTALIIGALAIDAIALGTKGWIEKSLDDLFKGEQKDEPKKD